MAFDFTPKTFLDLSYGRAEAYFGGKFVVTGAEEALGCTELVHFEHPIRRRRPDLAVSPDIVPGVGIEARDVASLGRIYPDCKIALGTDSRAGPDVLVDR